MTILKPTLTHHTNEFTWNPATKTFTAEGSDLNWPIGWPKLGRVYDDACDEGFTLVSDKTGSELTLVLDHIDQNDDCAGGWSTLTFVPAEHKQHDLFKVVVFND